MGVPKFFRWLSERYPKINQRHGQLPDPATCERYFGKAPPPPLEQPDPLSQCGLAPEIDRLYLDMNGIIHGCSHNNNVEDDETGGSTTTTGTTTPADSPKRVPKEEIFRNVCYYLDRVIGDIAQPNHLVYMAIDGVAPRAKLNQQRSRRYRSGLEGQIETTIYEAHAQKLAREEEQRLAEEQNLSMGGRLDDHEATPFSMDDGYSFTYIVETDVSGEPTHPNIRSNRQDPLEEVSPGRFKGKFEATTSASSDGSSSSSTRTDEHLDGIDDVFHSNVITPGTPFFQDFTAHLEHFVQYKIATDPKWQKLTIIFSGPNVPGEGEHKIMDFIRAEKRRPDYDPNLRHCIMGQDGDLIMLGLATHEPNLVLLRERVVFNMTKRKLAFAQAENGLDSYLHNGHFEFLHMGVLRDYLAFEFETSNVLSTSVFDLEHTIDDFVFMTFFVGNDFLPHMPALDIADHAFDLLFSTYKECRAKWAEEDPDMPYLTHAGNIVSGRRLEDFLTSVGNHEVAYYDKKKQSAPSENKRIKRVFQKFGIGNTLPDEKLVASKEESDRAAYRKMLLQEQMQLVDGAHDETEREEIGAFNPVMTRDFQPTEEGKEVNEGLISRLGSLLQNSLSRHKEIDSSEASLQSMGIDDTDLKGRYYYDKFRFTPFDEENHLALRKAYIEGLVWNLKYYYEGCPSWEWYFPYHYGPMLSDLVNLDEILDEVSFKGREGVPLKPFEQLMGCMPPSQAKHL
jgi:5'-3' exonuclease